VVLFVLYLILFVGGIVVMGLAFGLPAFQGLVFFVGLMLVCAAVASPMVVSAIENRGGTRR
jgi:hypothetical protein